MNEYSNVSMLNRLKDIAYSLLDNDSERRCRHFSFIIHKGRLISTGTNNAKTHPLNLINRKISKITGDDYSDQKQTCSELNAILKLKRLTNIDTKKCILVNIRFNRNNEIALAKPCMSCDNLLKYHNFKQIFWTLNNGKYASSKDILG
jgi:deoxycytidylate deaminase